MHQAVGDIRVRIAQHNRAMLAQAIGCAVLTPLLWLISLGLAWLLAAAILSRLLPMTDAVRFASIVAGVTALLLLLESIRLARSHAGHNPDAAVSDLESLISPDDSYATRMILNDAVMAGCLFEVILCAPRVLARAIRTWQRRIVPAPTDVDAMTQIIKRLERTNGWIPARIFAAHTRPIAMLQTMDLIWLKPQGDDVSVRLNPSYCP